MVSLSYQLILWTAWFPWIHCATLHIFLTSRVVRTKVCYFIKRKFSRTRYLGVHLLSTRKGWEQNEVKPQECELPCTMQRQAAHLSQGNGLAIQEAANLLSQTSGVNCFQPFSKMANIIVLVAALSVTLRQEKGSFSLFSVYTLVKPFLSLLPLTKTE